MKKIFTLVIAIVGVAFTSSAQVPPNIEWQESLGGSGGDVASSIQQTTDGGFVVAGYSDSNDGDVSGNHGNRDYGIVKLDAEGNILWQKSLGGSGEDAANSIQQTTDGGFVVAGYSDSNDGDVSGNHGNGDYWIVKLDADGNIVWQKSLGGSSSEEAYSIQQTTDDGFIVSGMSLSNDGDVSGNHGGSDYWIVKLDVDGNLVWQKSLGGSSFEDAYSIQQTTDGGFIVAGRTFSKNGDVSGNHGRNDYWIVKLDADGNLVWQKSLGGTSHDFANSIQQTTDGGFIVAGFTESKDGDVSGKHGNDDYWIVKLDANGNIVWQKCLGGSVGDAASSIQQTTDGGFIVAGYSSSNDGDVSGNHGSTDYWVVKLDSSANIQWQKSLGGSDFDYPYSIQQTLNGGFIIAGYSHSNDGDVSGNHGSYDYWIVKLSSEDQSCLAPTDLSVTNITATTAQLNWTIEGTPSDFRVSFKTLNGTAHLRRVPGSASSITLLNLTPNTMYSWNVKARCSATLPSPLAIGKRFRTDNLKEGEAIAGPLNESISLYPNPSSGNFTLDLKLDDEENSQAIIQVLNMLGQVVYDETTSVANGVLQKEIQLSDAAAEGMYLVKVTINDQVFSSQINLQK